jgi:hypothetical protein
VGEACELAVGLWAGGARAATALTGVPALSCPPLPSMWPMTMASAVELHDCGRCRLPLSWRPGYWRKGPAFGGEVEGIVSAKRLAASRNRLSICLHGMFESGMISAVEGGRIVW